MSSQPFFSFFLFLPPTTSSQHRPVSRFLPEESPLLQLFPPSPPTQTTKISARPFYFFFLFIYFFLAVTVFRSGEKKKKHRAAIMDMVKKKIRTLQQELDDAEERELAIQRELDTEVEQREKVREFALFTLKM